MPTLIIYVPVVVPTDINGNALEQLILFWQGLVKFS